MNVSSRLFRLLKVMAEDKVTSISRFMDQGGRRLDEKLESWESAYNLGGEENGDEATRSKAGPDPFSADPDPAYSRQTIDDLKLFGLDPPASFEAVKQARNREMKKFHPDKYQNDPEKLEIAKQIVQIYNSAYDRLKTYYGVK